MQHFRFLAAAVVVNVLAVSFGAVWGPPAAAQPHPSVDPFYEHTGPDRLADIAPGAVLKRREVTVHLAGLPLPVSADQVLYRTTSELGRPEVTVATVLTPPTRRFDEPRLVSFQMAYDSLTADCAPSYVIAGGGLLGSTVQNPALPAELAAIASYLAQGYTVVTSDYEGPRLAWLAGRQSARGVLDGIRAAINARPELTRSTPVGLVGYSGGGIASQWAAQEARRYAPRLRIVGTAAGAFMVHPARNLSYVDGSLLWSSVIPGAVVGLARGARVDLDRYLSPYGKRVAGAVADQCIGEMLGRYPGLRAADLFRPALGEPLSIPAVARVLNRNVMGRSGTPAAPVFFSVGVYDGRGDGVMVADDMRRLARIYCRRGVDVRSTTMPGLEHFTGFPVFNLAAQSWLVARFDRQPSTGNCPNPRGDAR